MPLSGIKVIEIGQNIAGPFAATILGDLGADVIKVEKPGGDDARGWLVKAGDRTLPLSFHLLNHNKRSVVVDFKNPAEMARLHGLLREADVLVHNLRPGLAEDLGLGAEAMLELNPRLVYCEVSAFGHKGPLRRKPGYEPLGHAYSGIMAVNGEPDGPPLRTGPSIVDPGTGMWSAIGILAALRRRDSTGKGGVVNTSLLETALTWVYAQAANFMLTGNEPPRHGNGNANLVPYQVFETGTQAMMIAAGNNRLFARLCKVVGHPEWAEDARFGTVAERNANRTTLLPMLQEVLLGQSQAHWRERLDAEGIPNAPINSVGQAATDPQTEALGMICEEPETALRMYGLPLSIDGERPAPRRRTPELGEHTEEVLGRFGS